MDLIGAMRLFEKVAGLGSISAAARELGLSSSAASRRMQELEEELGVRLINRSTRRISLTETGEACLVRAQALIEEADRLREVAGAAEAEPRGTLRVTCSAILGNTLLARLIPDFLVAHPAVRMELDLTAREVDLLGEGFDLSVRVGALTDSALTARRLGSVAYQVVAAPSYIARRGRPATPHDLIHHDCVVSNVVARTGIWGFEAPEAGAGGRIDAAVSTRTVINSLVSIHLATLGGAGIADLPDYLVAGDIAAGRLVALLTEFRPAPDPIHAVWPHRTRTPVKVRAFVDHLAERLPPMLVS